MIKKCELKGARYYNFRNWRFGRLSQTEEVKEKIKQAHLGEKNHFFGKHHKQETIEKMRLIKTGKVVPEYVRVKMRRKRPGLKRSPMSDEHKLAISNGNKGVSKSPRSDDHKRKIGAAHKGNKWCNNGIEEKMCHEIPEGFSRGRLKKSNTIK